MQVNQKWMKIQILTNTPSEKVKEETKILMFSNSERSNIPIPLGRFSKDERGLVNAKFVI